MKKFIKWIKNPASDFVLFILVIVLANLVGSRAFKRIDLTGPKSYSLSKASKQTVKTIEAPLTVNVFFSNNLPSPYNSVDQYISDLLTEYKTAGNKYFNYKFFNMDEQENKTMASNYGLSTVQIQQVTNNQVGFTKAWMGLAIVYQDRIETLDSLTTSNGLEYKLTQKIAKIINETDALAGLSSNDKIKLTLYVSGKLSDFSISGFDKIDSDVKEAFDKVNKTNLNRLTFEKQDPDSGTIPLLAKKYGIQAIQWNKEDGTKGSAILGLVLSYKDKFRIVPLSMQQTLFGGYAISGLDTLEDSISESLQSLVSKSTEIGYLTGNKEPSLYDSKQGAGLFNTLISDIYSFKTLDLSKDDIPSNLQCIVINGPKSKLNDTVLYKLDQFLMKGGNLMIFADPYDITQQGYYQQPKYNKIDTGLNKLLKKYGATIGDGYVMSEDSYTQNENNYGKVNIYWAPLLLTRQLADSPITNNLGKVLFLKNAPINLNSKTGDDIKTTVLAKTTKKSWVMKDHIVLNPMMITPPGADKESEQNLAVLLEGKFSSAFDKAPVTTDNKKTAQSQNNITTENHISQSIQPGKVFITATSAVTSAQMIDEKGTETIAIFVRNIIDYMNGNGDLCSMRTKGLSYNTLNIKSGVAVSIAKLFNQYGIVILVIIAGLIAWKARNSKKKHIHLMYNPEDDRDSFNKSKKDKVTKEGNK